jgi:hypothetical protein
MLGAAVTLPVFLAQCLAFVPDAVVVMRFGPTRDARESCSDSPIKRASQTPFREDDQRVCKRRGLPM